MAAGEPLTVHPAGLEPPDPPLTDGVIALRPWRDDDVDQVLAACQDPAIQQFLPLPHPYTRRDAEQYVERTRRQWADATKAAFAIVDVVDPSVVLGAINVAICGAAGNTGYWVAPGARGLGVATRALLLLTDWVFGHLQLGVVLLEIHPANLASRSVARAAGFHEAGRLDVPGYDGTVGHLLFSRLAGAPSPSPA